MIHHGNNAVEDRVDDKEHRPEADRERPSPALKTFETEIATYLHQEILHSRTPSLAPSQAMRDKRVRR